MYVVFFVCMCVLHHHGLNLFFLSKTQRLMGSGWFCRTVHRSHPRLSHDEDEEVELAVVVEASEPGDALPAGALLIFLDANGHSARMWTRPNMKRAGDSQPCLDNCRSKT